MSLLGSMVDKCAVNRSQAPSGAQGGPSTAGTVRGGISREMKRKLRKDASNSALAVIDRDLVLILDITPKGSGQDNCNPINFHLDPSLAEVVMSRAPLQVLYCTLLYSTLLYSILLYFSTLLLYSTSLLYSTLLYSTLPYRAILYYTCTRFLLKFFYIF